MPVTFIIWPWKQLMLALDVAQGIFWYTYEFQIKPQAPSSDILGWKDAGFSAFKCWNTLPGLSCLFFQPSSVVYKLMNRNFSQAPFRSTLLDCSKHNAIIPFGKLKYPRNNFVPERQEVSSGCVLHISGMLQTWPSTHAFLSKPVRPLGLKLYFILVSKSRVKLQIVSTHEFGRDQS